MSIRTRKAEKLRDFRHYPQRHRRWRCWDGCERCMPRRSLKVTIGSRTYYRMLEE